MGVTGLTLQANENFRKEKNNEVNTQRTTMFQMTHISMGQDMDKYKKTGEETDNLGFSKVFPQYHKWV